ncbi:hypothetical protein TeGR_g5576, partial [Tetraparma gracilis]
PPPPPPPPGPAAGPAAGRAAPERSYAALERVPLPSLRLCACSSVAHGRLEAPCERPGGRFEAEHGSRFVEAALRAALGYARRHGPPPEGELRVELRADGGFYSEGSPEVVDDAAAPTGKRVQVNKTGMGSSACLATSLVGALLSFLAAPLPPGALLNLSQLAHCASQGKVGSGFDVAAAVGGGQLYTRFPKEVLEVASPLEGGVGRLAWVAEGRGAIVAGAYQPEAPAGAPPLWGAGAAPQKPFSLRELGLRLYLADVRGGSDSPSMARASDARVAATPTSAAAVIAVEPAPHVATPSVPSSSRSLAHGTFNAMTSTNSQFDTQPSQCHVSMQPSGGLGASSFIDHSLSSSVATVGGLANEKQVSATVSSSVSGQVAIVDTPAAPRVACLPFQSPHSSEKVIHW